MTDGDLPRIFVGIDPGNTGALAALDDTGRLVVLQDLPIRKTLVGKRARSILDLCEWARIVDDLATRHWIVRCAIEKQQPMPLDGVVGAWTLSGNYHGLLGVLHAHMIVPEIVPWRAWRAAANLPLKAATDALRKGQSVARASDLWPARASELARHGRAEAALIARWCLMCGQGTSDVENCHG